MIKDLPKENNRKTIWAVISSLVVAFILIWVAYFSLPDGKLHVTFFDVGQGDSALIETPKGQKILIDGGLDDSVLSKLGRTVPFYDRTIDVIILSHPHQDHISGLIDVVKKYDVKNIVMTGVIHKTDEYNEWLKLIDDKDIPVQKAISGLTMNFDSDVSIKVIYPFEDLSTEERDDLNNTSVVCKLSYKDFSTLFTGDSGSDIQGDIVNSDADLKATVLKIPHHGSKDGLYGTFLEKVNPSFAVISVGAGNDFGHPAKETLDKLQDIGFYRTDQSGDIEFISNGAKDKIDIKTSK